jgi:pyruvate formate lyase activating enzyme
LAREAGLRNIFVTNGYMSQETITLLSRQLDAANIDLKFFKESSYRKICAASLGPVLDSIKLLKASGVWVEITTLIIPGQNDSPEELAGIAGFIAGVDKDIPWHISRFHPDYKFNLYDSTPESTLKLAYNLGIKEGLRYVYVGNFGAWGQDTLCVQCRKTLIRREGFRMKEFHLRHGRCEFCRQSLPGVFD